MDIRYTSAGTLTFTDDFKLNEHSIYGSSRLGTRTGEASEKITRQFTITAYTNNLFTNQNYTSVSISNNLTPHILVGSRKLGFKNYELTNHLSSSISIVSDRKAATASGTNVTEYIPVINVTRDLYAFGSEKAARCVNSTDYKYSFGGQLAENEISGNGNSYSAEFWQYDSRVGRRWNQDPRPNPSLSTYCAFANNPILVMDPKGDTTYNFNIKTGQYINMTDLTKAGQQVTFLKIETVKEIYITANGTTSSYDRQVTSAVATIPLNDPYNADGPAIREGKITRFELVDEKYIAGQMKIAFPNPKVKDLGYGGKLAYFEKEGKGGGNLDLGIKICGAGGSDCLFVSGAKAYNVADFGNFLIGRAAAEIGLPLWNMKLGGQYNHITNGESDVNSCYNKINTKSGTYSAGTFDSAADQQAIEDGFNSYKKP